MLAIIFRVGGAAVDAAEITPVGDGDTQISNLSAEFVVKRHERERASQETKTPESGAWMSGADEKLHIFVDRSFPSTGGPGVSTQTLIPGGCNNRAAEASPLPP